MLSNFGNFLFSSKPFDVIACMASNIRNIKFIPHARAIFGRTFFKKQEIGTLEIGRRTNKIKYKKFRKRMHLSTFPRKQVILDDLLLV